MLRVVVQALRARWISLVSTVLALVIGVALVTVAGDVLAGVITAQPRPGPDHRRDTEALVTAGALVGTAGGLVVFVAIFVVASTFAYAVARRHREFALLRMIGATPGQIRRQVLAEALVLGVVSAVTGCVLGRLATPMAATWLTRHGFAPPWFDAPRPVVASVIAAALGVSTALTGAWMAAWRAGRIRPVQALREASVQHRPMSALRWVAGLSLAGAAVAMLVMPVLSAPEAALNRKHYIPMIMLLVVAFAALAPVLTSAAARLLTWPLCSWRSASWRSASWHLLAWPLLTWPLLSCPRLSRPWLSRPWLSRPWAARPAGGAVLLLVRQGVLVAVRRTAAGAAPVLLTVGLAAGLLSTTATIDRERNVEIRNQFTCDYVITPDGAPGIGRAVVDRARAIPGVRATASYSLKGYAADPDGSLIRHGIQAIDLTALPQVMRLPVVAGSLSGLVDADIVVDQDWHRSVGEVIRLRLPNKTWVPLRVAAVIRTGVNGNGAFIAERYAGSGALADRILVDINPAADSSTGGADPAGIGTAGVDFALVATDLGRAIAGSDTRAWRTPEWIRANASHRSAVTTAGLWMMLGITLLYSLLSVAGTMAMAAWDRREVLALLRRSGATAGQVRCYVAGEALLTVAIGVLLAVGAGVLSMAGLCAGVLCLSGRLPSIDLAWAPVAAIALICGLVAVATALLGSHRGARA